MHRDAHIQHTKTHTLQHLEGNLVIKNTPRHSTHSLIAPKHIHITHRQITQQKRIHRDKFQTMIKNTQAHTDTQHTYKPNYGGISSRRQDPCMQGRGQHPTLSKSV